MSTKAEIVLKRFYFTCNHGIRQRNWTESGENVRKAYMRKNSTQTNIPQFTCKNCSYDCAYDWIQTVAAYTIQHRTVPIIFPLILQTITTAQVSTVDRGSMLTRLQPRSVKLHSRSFGVTMEAEAGTTIHSQY